MNPLSWLFNPAVARQVQTQAPRAVNRVVQGFKGITPSYSPVSGRRLSPSSRGMVQVHQNVGGNIITTPKGNRVLAGSTPYIPGSPTSSPVNSLRTASSSPRVTTSNNPILNAGRNPLMMGLGLVNNPITQGIVLGTTTVAPLLIGTGEYLRSDRGQLLKDRLRQGDFGGAFNALTGSRINTPISFDVGDSLSNRPTNTRRQPAPGRDLPPAPTLPPPPGIDETLTSSRAPASTQRGPQIPGAGAGNLAAVAPTVYDMTPEGQFQRYMQGSEMNRYFGGPASAQAPKDAAAMQETAMLQQAPTNMPLADYYRSQSAAGRANMDNIVSSMGYTGNMEQWARANPMLAQRAYAQQFQGGVPTQGAPGAVPAVDATLNPAGPEFRGVGGDGERIYNFAADDVTPEKIKAFQDLLKKQAVQ